MYNKIILYLGLPGTTGTIELDKFGPNYFAPVNANVAQNANGRRIGFGEYEIESIANVQNNPTFVSAFGVQIIRLVNRATGAKIAIFGGDPGQHGELLPTEGSSVRVSNDTLNVLISQALYPLS